MSETGFLVCADITGYTAYLSDSELEHASGILGDLLQLLLGETKAPLHLSRVEGDAVISYAEAMDGIDPQVLVDRLEATYVAFRRALEQMVLNTSCTCNACANIANLDLKLVVHHGAFIVQHLGNQDELLGPEVNFMFRLVKNHVRQELGIPGYIAFTDAAVAALALPGYTGPLVAHTEEDQERGTSTIHVKDMTPVWTKRRHERFVELDSIAASREMVIDAPVEVVWSYLARPQTRAIAMGADAMDPITLEDGRIGRDAVYVCFHGEAKITQTILDWDPPFRSVWVSALPDGLSVQVESLSEPIDAGSTKVTVRWSHPIGPRLKARRARATVSGLVDGTIDDVEAALKAMATTG